MYTWWLVDRWMKKTKRERKKRDGWIERMKSAENV